MKIRILLTVLTLGLAFSSFASNDKKLNFEELPTASQLFIKTYFPEIQFKSVVRRSKNGMYQTNTSDGWIFTFGKNGNWIDIDCHNERVPSPLIPSPILNAIAQKYGTSVKVVKITITRRGNYMVKLSNYVRLGFDKHYRDMKINIE